MAKGEGHAPQFSAILQHHLSRIKAARLLDEPVIWGGDFNQELTGPITAGTDEGRVELMKAFDGLELDPLTMNSRHLIPGLSSIDHIAVSAGWMTWGELEVHGKTGDGVPKRSRPV